MLYQQGDVLFKQVASTKGKLVEGTPIIVARGEATGHAHRILDDVRALVDGDTMFIKADKPFTVTHEEHKPVTIPVGIWQVGRVLEYDHFTEEARHVQD